MRNSALSDIDAKIMEDAENEEKETAARSVEFNVSCQDESSCGISISANDGKPRYWVQNQSGKVLYVKRTTYLDVLATIKASDASTVIAEVLPVLSDASTVLASMIEKMESEEDL